VIAGSPGSRDFLFAAMHWSQTDPNAWGDPGSWLAYGPMWAQVSMTPFSQYKALMAEGGIHNALIVSGPVVNRPKGSINQGLMHVADIMPTLLEIAGTSYPKTYAGKETLPAFGKSWGAVLAGRAESPRTDLDVLAWEVFGNRALRQGNWKLRWEVKPLGTGDWELFDLATDPGELKDLSAARPEKVQEMIALWDDYARTNNVILPNRTPFESLEKSLPQRVPVQAGYPPANLKRQYVPPADMMADPKPEHDR
jgi:arylsulfatase